MCVLGDALYYNPALTLQQVRLLAEPGCCGRQPGSLGWPCGTGEAAAYSICQGCTSVQLAIAGQHAASSPPLAPGPQPLPLPAPAAGGTGSAAAGAGRSEHHHLCQPQIGCAALLDWAVCLADSVGAYWWTALRCRKMEHSSSPCEDKEKIVVLGRQGENCGPGLCSTLHTCSLAHPVQAR